MSSTNTALEIQHAVLTALLEHLSVAKATPRFLAEIAPTVGIDVGMLWLLDRRSATRALYCAATWARDPEAMGAFLTASRARRFRIGDGPQAEVWEAARPLFITATAPELALPRHADISAAGLRNVFAIPLEGEDRVLGVLEGFRRVDADAPAVPLRAVGSLGPLLGLALLREETERTRLETAARLSSLIQNMGSGTLVENEHRRIALVNQAFCDLFRIPVPPAALVGTDCSQAAEQSKQLFRDPEDFIRRTEAALAGRERILADEFELVDGTIVERDYIPVFVTGAYVGHLWTYRDVTAQRFTQAENRRLRSFYEQVLEAVPAQVAVFDREARFLYVNAASIGDAATRQWVIGKTNEDYCVMRGVPVEVGAERTAQIRKAGDDNRLLYFEESFERHGTRRTFGRFVSPVLDASGQVVQVIGFGLELTETKQAEAALQAGQSRLQAILDSSLDCVITLDLDGRVIDFSATAEETFGWRHESVAGQPMVERLIHADHRDELRRALAAGSVAEHGVLGRYVEMTGLRATGEAFPVELAVTLVEPDGGQPIFTVFLRDITERKRAKLELQEARVAAERSAAAKEQFLASISHELRTPLNAVAGLTHLLERTPLDPEQQHSLTGIRFAADALLDIINDLLDLSRSRAGRMSFESIPFDLRSLLDGLRHSVLPSAERRGLSLDVRIADDVTTTVQGDPGRLNQVLLNLVSNAIKFTEAGGVDLEVSRVLDAPDVLRFQVRDTGIGVAPEDHERIFAVFEQAEPETTRRFGGTGLGLAIVRELVHQQGGTVTLRSEVGEGSCFDVVLPFPAAADLPAPLAPTPAEATRLTGRRLLLVEDNEMNRFVATRILEQAGATVVVAVDGRDALARMRREEFDLVLMDIQMPEMDGYEATWRIRHELGLDAARLPIIALTATALTDESRRAEASGMTDVVLKPFRPEVLCARVAAALAHRPHRESDDAPSPVDRGLLADRTAGDPEFAAALLEIFERTVPEQLRGLEAAAGAGNAPAIMAAAHKLKAQAGTIGATALQEGLAELELAARPGGEGPAPLRARTEAVVAIGNAALADVVTLRRGDPTRR